MYTPQPMDTTEVELPHGFDELIEKLAKHNHDIWARRRLAEGWRWGPERDDQQKHHPCLVSYEELSEVEKDYDRWTSTEALKAIVALGYEIQPTTVVKG